MNIASCCTIRTQDTLLVKLRRIREMQLPHRNPALKRTSVGVVRGVYDELVEGRPSRHSGMSQRRDRIWGTWPHQHSRPTAVRTSSEPPGEAWPNVGEERQSSPHGGSQLVYSTFADANAADTAPRNLARCLATHQPELSPPCLRSSWTIPRSG